MKKGTTAFSSIININKYKKIYIIITVIHVFVVVVSMCCRARILEREKKRTQRLSHLAVPTILNRILTTTRQGLADLTPTISEFRLKFHYNCILLRCPFAFSQRTVQMIEPSLSAFTIKSDIMLDVSSSHPLARRVFFAKS